MRIIDPKTEVLSLPAGTTIDITEATLVHACPDRRPWSSYQDTEYITFRHTGGVMKWLYKVVAKPILLDPFTDMNAIPPDYRERVTTYVNRRRREWTFDDERYGDRFTFYLLSQSERIELSHLPRLFRNTEGHCYIRLADLISEKDIVHVSSAVPIVPDPVMVNPIGPPVATLLLQLEKSELENQVVMDNSFDQLPFDPYRFEIGGIETEKEQQAGTIYVRRGQPEFRQRLLVAYRCQCAISGYGVADSLEAAHIVPYCGISSNHISNGILLRGDIHTLFDLDLIRIEASSIEDYQIELDSTLLNSSYKYLQGKKLVLPNDRKNWPSLLALKYRRERMQRRS